MYQVFDNNIPAQYPECVVSPSWKNSKFNTFDEAKDYAEKWLGFSQVDSLELNKPVDYSGFGDYIEIRKIEDN